MVLPAAMIERNEGCGDVPRGDFLHIAPRCRSQSPLFSEWIAININNNRSLPSYAESRFRPFFILRFNTVVAYQPNAQSTSVNLKVRDEGNTHVRTMTTPSGVVSGCQRTIPATRRRQSLQKPVTTLALEHRRLVGPFLVKDVWQSKQPHDPQRRSTDRTWR